MDNAVGLYVVMTKASNRLPWAAALAVVTLAVGALLSASGLLLRTAAPPPAEGGAAESPAGNPLSVAQPASPAPPMAWWQVHARWQVNALEGASVTFEALPLETAQCAGPELVLRARRAIQLHHFAEGQQGEVSFCLPSNGVISRISAPYGVWRSLGDDEEVSVEWDADALRVPSPEGAYVLRLAALTGCADDDSVCTGAALLELVPERSDGRLSLPSGGFTSGHFDVLALAPQ